MTTEYIENLETLLKNTLKALNAQRELILKLNEIFIDLTETMLAILREEDNKS